MSTKAVVTFTPGPWHYQERSDAYTHIVRGPEDQYICATPQGTSGVCEANARLIAAAPDLLEACKAALQVIETWHGIGMTDVDRNVAWSIYLKNAPEMQPIIAAVEKAEVR